MVKNPPALQETWVQPLGQEYLLEEEMAAHSSILAWGNRMDRGAWRATVHGVVRSRTRVSDSTYDCYTKTRMKFLASPTLLDFCLLSFPRIRGDGSHVTLQRFSSKGQSSCMTGKGDFHLTTCISCFFSGSPYYDNVRPLSYPDSDAVLICFDISRPETLDSVLKKVSSRE